MVVPVASIWVSPPTSHENRVSGFKSGAASEVTRAPPICEANTVVVYKSAKVGGRNTQPAEANNLLFSTGFHTKANLGLNCDTERSL